MKGFQIAGSSARAVNDTRSSTAWPGTGALALVICLAHYQCGLSVSQPVRQAWTPAHCPVQAVVEPVHARIVDFGTDFLRDGDGRPVHQFGVHRYRLEKDTATGLWHPVRDFQLDLGFDVDDDGRGDDDVVGYHPFSLTSPFSPQAPWYDCLAGTPRWYGAAVIFQADRQETRFSEDGVNHDHDGPRHGPRDNWALFHETYEINSPYRMYALWFWKKEDFLNGGSDYRVSFNEKSELALYLQRYWMGCEGIRFLIQDGDKFYLSERTFRGAGQQPGSGNGKQHVLCPLHTRWAVYRPRRPYHIRFDTQSAVFEERMFENVQAVGWYIYKDKFIPSYFGFKWYALEVDVTVHRPERPSEHIDMASIPIRSGVPAFYMSTCEVPYLLWKDVFRLLRSNTFVRDPRGFIFDHDGDMGSMKFGCLSHSADEPVTDVTIHDVAAWCNGLSQLESKTPCYYEDPEHRVAFRFVRQSPLFTKSRPLPPLYVKWDADGYRLPTPSEWKTAFKGQEISSNTGWIASNSQGRTHPAGQKKPSGFGLYDMIGNVWELTWSFGDSYDPQTDVEIIVLGGDFQYPARPRETSASPYGDRPFRGSYNVGFRIVRDEGGLDPPVRTMKAPESGAPSWVIHRDDRTRSDPNGQINVPIASSLVETVEIPNKPIAIARHETTFRIWKDVYHWAAAHGYKFDQDGDMGSMDYWGFRGSDRLRAHCPDEPVTDLTLYDCMLFCNALSEIEGLVPVYYHDKACAQVYRRAFIYRPLMMLFFEADKADHDGIIDYNISKASETVYVKSDANGYRLPTESEYEYARTGAAQRYSWGDKPEEVVSYAWLFDTAMGTTHPVGGKKPNAFGLFDMEGNVSEAAVADRPSAMLRLGGSFIDLTIGVGRGQAPFSPSGWGYPDIGFRVAKQRPLQHTETRIAPKRDTAVLEADSTAYDVLKGRVFRGNLHRDGVFDATGLAKLAALKWRFSTDGPIKSSPVVVDGIVYFGSNDTHIYAVDAQTGAEVWRVKTADRVTGSAAAVGGVVYIASEDGLIYALDAANGAIKWKKGFSSGRPAGAPAVAYGVVFVPQGSRGGSEVVLMSAKPVVGLDAETGEPLWAGAGSPQGYAAPALDERTLYCGLNGSAFSATDLSTGKLLWSKATGHQDRQFYSMAISGNIVYGVGTIAGSVNAFDVKEGTLLWQAFTFPGQVAINNGGTPGFEIFTAPTLAHDRVYVGCNDGKLHTFDARTGKRGWTFQTAAAVQSSPSVAGRVVYFGSHDGHLYALDAISGALVWKYRTGGRIVSAPWPGDGMIFVGCDDGFLYALH